MGDAFHGVWKSAAVWLVMILLPCGCPPPWQADAGAEPGDAAVNQPSDGGVTDGAAADASRLDGAVADGSRPDAATADAGFPDAARVDGAMADASIPDASIPDASIPDASIPDASIPDASIPDASTHDACVLDASISDAVMGEGDAAVSDSSPSDADLADAGLPDADVPDAAAPDATATADGAVDLGWRWDAAVPAACPENPLDTTGTAWTGWVNYQYPVSQTVAEGETSASIYGQVYKAGDTDKSGQAPGWEAQLLVGPFGSVPTTHAACWDTVNASFNVDVGNNDEYLASYVPPSPGVRGLFFRYRPAGGAWKYGDLNGSNDGLQAHQAGLLVTPETTGQRMLVVVSLNLRCRMSERQGVPENWPERLPLVVRALARVNPDLVAFQEDCVENGGRPQSEEIRERLVPLVGRGYDLRWTNTHRAFDRWDEGVSILSAHPIEASGEVQLLPSAMGRKAIWVDVSPAGKRLRFHSTHLEVDFNNEARDAMRAAEGQMILDSRPPDTPCMVLGDFNAEPTEEVHTRFRAGGMMDAWVYANPNDPGLSFYVRNPTIRIDYVWVSSSVAPRIQGARMLDENNGTTWLSDHQGVAVALDWP